MSKNMLFETTKARIDALIMSKSDSDSKTVYYFGVGSNMLKSKLINRGAGKEPLTLLKAMSGYVKGYRLAFNCNCFPPNEPAMAGIEPCIDRECHGLLVEITIDDYHKLWLSEGGTVTAI
jgi:hypothetical protein